MRKLNKTVVRDIKRRTKAAFDSLTDSELLEIATDQISPATRAKLEKLDLFRLSDLDWALSTRKERKTLMELAAAWRQRPEGAKVVIYDPGSLDAAQVGQGGGSPVVVFLPDNGRE